MQKTKRINTAKKHQNTRSRTHTLLQHKSHSDSIWAPKCLPNAPQKRSKNDQKNKTKKEPKKRSKKEPNMRKKPDSAVNGKRCIQTLFVYFAFCCLHVVLHYFFSNISLKNVIFHTNFLKSSKNRYFYCSYVALGRSWAAFSCSWAALGRSWAALGRSWAALGALLGRSWPLLGRSWNDMQKSSKNRCQK